MSEPCEHGNVADDQCDCFRAPAILQDRAARDAEVERLRELLREAPGNGYCERKLGRVANGNTPGDDCGKCFHCKRAALLAASPSTGEAPVTKGTP